MAFAATMCTLVHSRMHVYECDRGVQNVHMHDVGVVHEHGELVSFEIRIPISYD